MCPPFTMRTRYSEWCRGEWGEDKEGGGRITRPFLMGMKGTWGPREGGRFQLLSEHQGWWHGIKKLVTSVLQLSSTSPSLGLYRCSAACWRGCAAFRPQPLFCLLSWCHITSGEIWWGKWGGPSRSWSILWARWSLSCAEVPFFLDIKGMEFLILPPTLRAFLQAWMNSFLVTRDTGLWQSANIWKQKSVGAMATDLLSLITHWKKNLGFAGLQSNWRQLFHLLQSWKNKPRAPNRPASCYISPFEGIVRWKMGSHVILESGPVWTESCWNGVCGVWRLGQSIQPFQKFIEACCARNLDVTFRSSVRNHHSVFLLVSISNVRPNWWINLFISKTFTYCPLDRAIEPSSRHWAAAGGGHMTFFIERWSRRGQCRKMGQRIGFDMGAHALVPTVSNCACRAPV